MLDARAPAASSTTWPARRCFEYKAGQAEQGDRHVQEARAPWSSRPRSGWRCSIESIRFRCRRPTIDEYAKLWDAELKKKHRSETAGEMAGLMTAFLASKTEYTGRADHIKQIVAYLRKTTSLKYRREDIEKVAEFLGPAPEQRSAPPEAGARRA